MGNIFLKIKKKKTLLNEPLIDSISLNYFEHDIILIRDRVNTLENYNFNLQLIDVNKNIELKENEI